MPPLPLIADLRNYRACIQDLLADGPDVFDYWLTLFENHCQTLGRLPMGDRRLEEHEEWGRFRRDYLEGLAEIRRRPNIRGVLNVLELTIYREEQFKAHGFGDPFLQLKQRENAMAFRVLPSLLAEIDASHDRDRMPLIFRGLYAGNQFDMGSRAVVEAFENGTFDFRVAREQLRARPWAVDELDGWLARLEASSYRKALFFVDNAGADVILGALPLTRELARRGTRVVLAANSHPALNDVTAQELAGILHEYSRLDPVLRDQVSGGLIEIVESGCGAPLIDLADCSAECCGVAADCDLLILEGMGRAIESNYDARFTVDTLKIALIKDPMVAGVIGVNLFDPVCRFEPAGGATSRNQ